MKRAMDETGEAKLFSANITADDHYEMLARGEFILEPSAPTPTRWPSWWTATWAARA
jgi:ribulose 1,5-bisphosphate carboxylase large subunit-like protein